MAALRSALATEPTMRAFLAPRIAVLLVDGDGVVRLGVDAVLDEEIHQLIALRRLLRLDDVEVEHVPVAGRATGSVKFFAPFRPAV